ncbi:MAG: cadherin repeat domain-containing protein, partial [Methylophilaceae bacterium]|nr:cadherin repeat domain-containing protein [Methylophilaceae bacterium]
DAAGNTSATSTAVTYTLDNTAPTVNATTFSVAENSTAVGSLAASETVTWSLGSGDDTSQFTLTNGVLSFSAAPNFEMPRGSAFNAANNNDAYTVNVIATDTAGNVKAQAIVVNVTDVNENPVLGTRTVNQTAVTGQNFSVNTATAFSDPDNETNSPAALAGRWGTLTYTATGLPTGLVINAATGAITGTITGIPAQPSDTISSTAFGGVVARVVSSGIPAATGSIGSTGNALQVVQNIGDQGWAGVTFATLAPGAEFINTANKVVTVKVYSPAAGLDVKLKFEDATDNTHTIEKDVLTTGSGWQLLTFDFSTVTPSTAPFNDTYNYNKGDIFLDFLDAPLLPTKTVARTFYVDDIAYQRVTASGVVASTITFDENSGVGMTVSTLVTVVATDGGGLKASEIFAITVAPVVQSFTVSDTTTANGAQLGKSGEPLVFVATMSEAVTVVTTGGTPSITFSVNGVAVTATYASGSGTNMLTFTGGTVPATGSGTAISLTSIALNGGTVTGQLSNLAWVTTVTGQIYAGYTVDNSTLALTLALASDTGSSASDSITSNTTINVFGLESGATWQYQVDNSAWITGAASSFTA